MKTISIAVPTIKSHIVLPHQIFFFGNCTFMVDLYAICSFPSYMIFFNSVKMSSFICGKYYVRNAFHMAQRVFVIYQVLGIGRVPVIVFVGQDMFFISYLKMAFCLSSVNIDIIKVLLFSSVIFLFIPYSTTHNEMYTFKKVKVYRPAMLRQSTVCRLSVKGGRLVHTPDDSWQL